MLVGRPPFRAESEYLLFQLILDHPANMALQLPDHVSDAAQVRSRAASVRGAGCADAASAHRQSPRAAQDLIRQLLHPDPAQRLGIGPAGTDRDYAALKVPALASQSPPPLAVTIAAHCSATISLRASISPPCT